MQATAEQPVSSDIGAFRTVCDYSHMAFDDPIVFPGQSGRSHLHVFFGNTGVTGASNAASIRASGNSTCRGGIVNRSAYWVPAIIDTVAAAPIRPDASHFYYKQGYEITPASSIKPLPEGLRMIAGDASATAPRAGAYRFVCYTNGVQGPFSGTQIPDCPAGTTHVLSEVFFPQCWDGVNLDSPDHKSHMSYVAQDQTPPFRKHCPSSHPVALPLITFNIWYPVGSRGTAAWRLSSDVYPSNLPGGYSMHGDWFNGWRKDVSDAWVQKCVEASKDCHSHLLGDGRAIY